MHHRHPRTHTDSRILRRIGRSSRQRDMSMPRCSTNREMEDRLSGWTAMRAVVTRLARDDSGQEIVEYGLLSALVGIAAILIWQQLVVTVGTTYGLANTDVQTMSACTPDP